MFSYGFKWIDCVYVVPLAGPKFALCFSANLSSVHIHSLVFPNADSGRCPWSSNSFTENFFLCSYEAKFHNGPPIRCEKYQVSADLCDNMGLTYVTMSTIWSAPDQTYAAQLLATLGKQVSK